jgi:DNA-binding NarL/FixJ family response regulator
MKETAANDLLAAVHEARKGNAFFSPAIAKRLLRRWEVGGDGSEPAELTGRQAGILELIAKGYTSKQMATLLSISIKTVEKHRQALMSKLDIHEIAGLTRYAVSIGAVAADPYSHMVHWRGVERTLTGAPRAQAPLAGTQPANH